MKKINKTVARKAFNDGKAVVLVPCNMQPKFGLMVSKNDYHGYDDFDKLNRAFTWFQCNNECGKYPHYYLAD